jgi:hypothetical protein
MTESVGGWKRPEKEPSLVIISLCLEGGGAERTGVAHVLVGGEDVLPQVPLLLRLKAALVTHEPAARRSGFRPRKKFQLKKNRIYHILSPKKNVCSP